MQKKNDFLSPCGYQILDFLWILKEFEKLNFHITGSHSE